MKNLITILIALHASLLTPHAGEAQIGCSCLPEGITFMSNEQIDNFQVNYPGCSVIQGDVDIFWVSDLQGLSVLTSIEGDLRIEECIGLRNLSGLNNLTSVGGKFQIGYEELGGGTWSPIQNDSILSLTGLANLHVVRGDLIIAGNYVLTDLSAISSLESIGGRLSVFGNIMLDNVEGLGNLTSIGGSLTISYNGISSLDGIENINPSSITDLKISNNPQLSDCEVQSICNYLANPAGKVDIFANGPGCSNPGEIAAICGIDIPCLPEGNYYFLSQAEIDNFPTYFPDCHDLMGNVSITGSDITNLNGLQQICSIGGDFKLGCYGYDEGGVGNPLLGNLSGIENLTRIGGAFWILERNESLVSLDGLENLSHIGSDFLIGVSFVHSLSRERGFPLANIEALGNLDSIGGMFNICGTQLKEFSGLESLTNIDGPLEIYSNDALTSISALSSLSSIGGSLVISHNDSIESLNGLDNINPNSIKKLRINTNKSLSTCEVQSICASLAIADSNTSIHENAEGCNSQQEIEDACAGVGVSESAVGGQQSAVSVVPNPAVLRSEIRYQVGGQQSAVGGQQSAVGGNVRLTVHDITGKQIRILADEAQAPGEHVIDIDVSGLPAGIYVVRLETEGAFASTKMVVIE